MKIGFLISMYDEINTVENTIKVVQEEKYKIIVIQSDPNNKLKILNKNKVDHYEKFSDLAGSKEKYLKERDQDKIEFSSIPVKAITRNLSAGFSVTKKFDVDWWIVILGDVVISEITGIQKIINKMNLQNKSIGVTRAIGQVFMDDNNKLTRIQHRNTTDFMPQFFIVKSDLIKKGLFSKFRITNRFATEQCLGDEVNRFCLENNTNFSEITFIISDYAYPQFISGLKYNPDRIKMPRYIDGFVNFIRRRRIKY